MRLRTKFMLVIFAILISGVTLTMVWLHYSSSQNAAHQAIESNIDLSDAIGESVLVLMKTGQQDHLDAYLENARKLQSVAELRVIRSPALEKELGVKESSQAQDGLDRQALESGQRIVKEVTVGKKKAIRTITSFTADPSCLACHPTIKEGQVMAALSETLVYQASLDAMMRHLFESGLIQGFIIVLVIGAVFLFIDRSIMRPVARIGVAVRKFAKGDWTVIKDLNPKDHRRLSVVKGSGGPQGSLDEISALAVAFGEMIMDLKEMTVSRDEIMKEFSDRKRVEDNFTSLIQKNELILNSTAEGILGLDLQGRHTFVNSSAARMLGYEVKELLGRPSHSLWHHTKSDGEPSPKENCAIYAAYQDGKVHHSFDEVFWRKDGTPFPVEYSSTPIYEKGRLAGAVVVFSDITEKKGAEVFKDVSREVLRVLNVSGEMQDSVQGVDAVLKKYTGFDAVGIRLQDGDDFPYVAQQGFPDDFLLTENTLVERVKDGGLCRNKDGSVCLGCTCGLVISGKTDPSNPLFTPGGSFWTNDSLPLLKLPPDQDLGLHPRNQCIHHGYASVALVPIRNKEKIIGLIQFNDRRKGRFTPQGIALLEGIAAHIGAALMRKQAEVALRESENKFKNLVETSYDWIWEIDAQGIYTYVSPRIKDVLGYEVSEAMGKTPFDFLIEEEKVSVRKFFEELLVKREAFHGYENTNRHKDGHLVYLETSGVPVMGEDGRIQGYRGIDRDITERRRMTEALKKSYESLEVQVKERTAELENSYQQLKVTGEDLKRASKAKSEFLANMSHELRTPLNSIIGFSEVLYDEKFGSLNERQKKYAHNVMQSGRHLLALINDVLDLSKVEAGKMVLEVSRCSIQGCLDEVLRLMEHQVSEKKIKPVMEIPSDLGEIPADQRKIKQILFNLLSNAIKFTPAEGTVGVRARRIDAGIEVAVWDTGIGISPGDLEKPFGAFERLGDPYKHETEGTGLGLTISKKMVELHGGRIWIESEGLGKGTTVKFVIPSRGEGL